MSFYVLLNCSCLGIGDAGLEALSSGCKKLMKLNLSYCNKLTDRGMGYIGLLEELCVLEIRGLHNVTGVGLTAVAAGCKRLVDLDMKQCQNVDDSGFWALASYAHNLRQVSRFTTCVWEFVSYKLSFL